MAQPPQSPPKHTPPPQGLPPQPQGVPPPPPSGNVVKHGEAPKVEAGGYRPTIGVKGEAIDDGERDPDTIAEEQRARSDEMERDGMAKWIAEHDERKGEHEAQKQVSGAQAKIESHKAP